jgi:hypothetical protein
MTTLDPHFLSACLLIQGFKAKPMLLAQGALLTMALTHPTITAADLPTAITNGSRHLAGAATGSLISMGLLEVVSRIKSPDPKAHGRKLDVLRIPTEKLATARTFLARNNFPAVASPQLLMTLSA